jgi:hypothetical protein
MSDTWEPLPRYVVLPGDPAPLRSWLRVKAVEEHPTPNETEETSWPQS